MNYFFDRPVKERLKEQIAKWSPLTVGRDLEDALKKIEEMEKSAQDALDLHFTI